MSEQRVLRTAYLAYYHRGFTDDWPELLQVCDDQETADSVIDEHKKNRDATAEYKPHGTTRASWDVEERDVITEKPAEGFPF